MASSSIFKFIQFVGLLSLFSILSACSEGPGGPGTGILYPEKLVLGSGIHDVPRDKFRYEDDGSIYYYQADDPIFKSKSLKMTFTDLKFQLDGEELKWPQQEIIFNYLGNLDKKATNPIDSIKHELEENDHYIYSPIAEIDYGILTPKMKSYFMTRRLSGDKSPELTIQFRLKSIEGLVVYKGYFKGATKASDAKWVDINFKLQPDVLVSCLIENLPLTTNDGKNRLVYFDHYSLLSAFADVTETPLKKLISDSDEADSLTYDNARFKEENKTSLVGTDPNEAGYLMVENYLNMKRFYGGQVKECKPVKN